MPASLDLHDLQRLYATTLEQPGPRPCALLAALRDLIELSQAFPECGAPQCIDRWSCELQHYVQSLSPCMLRELRMPDLCMAELPLRSRYPA